MFSGHTGAAERKLRFDDRLKTAITQPVVDDHDRIVRWRQLVDLLSRLPEQHDEALADAAFALVEREAISVPEAVRAASARNAAAQPLDGRLVALFARDKLSVAAPVLASANLSAMEWHEISRDSSPEVAHFIMALSRGTTAASPISVAEPVEGRSVLATSTTEDQSAPSISQMVARIEQLRTRRESEPLDAPADPVAPSVAQPREAAPDRVAAAEKGGALFRWESDAEGRIAWVDGVPRGAFVGQALADVADDLSRGRALASREPFADAAMTLDHPAMAGEWRMSGIPAFSPVDGRFLGYRGIARKPTAPAAPRSPSLHSHASQSRPRDLDSLRETIHEIKTPLNAIIGFAEIIDGQYLGPAHRNYRQRAAEIVTQARMLLEAVQDLDIAARGQVGSSEMGGSNRAADTLRSLQPEFEQAAMREGAELSVVLPGRDERFAMSSELASRLLRRFLAAVIAVSRPGERLVVATDRRGENLVVTISRPMSSAQLSPSTLLDPAYATGGGKDGLLGLGFALRLVRGLARMADGDLNIEADHFTLILPAA